VWGKRRSHRALRRKFEFVPVPWNLYHRSLFVLRLLALYQFEASLNLSYKSHDNFFCSVPVGFSWKDSSLSGGFHYGWRQFKDCDVRAQVVDRSQARAGEGCKFITLSSQSNSTSALLGSATIYWNVGEKWWCLLWQQLHQEENGNSMVCLYPLPTIAMWKLKSCLVKNLQDQIEQEYRLLNLESI